MSGTEDIASQPPQEKKSPQVQAESVINEIFPQQPLEEKISGEITKVPGAWGDAGTKEDVPQKIKEKVKRKNNTKKNRIKVAKRKKSKKNDTGMKKKAKKNNKATNKNLIKVVNDKKEADSDFASKLQEVENTMNDAQGLNLKLVEEVVKNHGGGDDALGLVLKPVEEIAERNPKNDNPGAVPKPLEGTAEKITRRDNPELPSKPSLASTYFVLLVLASLVLFLLAGYTYPATEEDIAKNKIFWIVKDGEFDRGLFTQFYASLIFTTCVYILGYYVNSTFIRFGLGGWTTFSIGIYMIFLFGLGKIGELTYNHELFSTFENLILPFALIILAYASYKILKELKGGAKNVS